MPANAELECPCRRKYDNHELTVEALMQERKVSAALLATIRVLTEDKDRLRADLLPIRAAMAALNSLLSDAKYALEYAADMTKPDDLSGCTCPICTTLPKIDAALEGME